jgi:5-formyltetrahydrofolate cyclo-ligase
MSLQKRERAGLSLHVTPFSRKDNNLCFVEFLAMVHPAKQLLRQQIRQLLKLMASEDRLSQSNYITTALLRHPKYLSARSISVYVHMSTEVSTRDIIQHAFLTNKRVFIPRYSSDSMDMVRVHSLDDLDSLPMTKWNIRQPLLDDTTREIASADIDLILVPGLGFSLDGARLGHGKGFYDRYLSSLSKHSYKIGLAYRQQLVENGAIPMNPSDVWLDEILVSKDD